MCKEHPCTNLFAYSSTGIGYIPSIQNTENILQLNNKKANIKITKGEEDLYKNFSKDMQ